jgi:hypothetical protein
MRACAGMQACKHAGMKTLTVHSPGVTTCLLVRMMPLALSTTKPVAYELPAASVSKARVCVTLRGGEQGERALEGRDGTGRDNGRALRSDRSSGGAPGIQRSVHWRIQHSL